ncbi:DUF2290 domain-containing protein [Mucilaginibacter sp. SG564]|uniref:DUF2290 domain-containing protein n=1 Tax=Mucilaginibacter sp. SG564 TaxID=2587022 RepID=UPI00155241E1|nr:DUF2290 domain-containing protein [Mucilaginibacter sp. SG564]NOW96586.1 hypothetical protein [Mucilaginibacter sp. SG564]
MPSSKNQAIVWDNYKNISFTLKNQSYIDLYNECIKEKAYNFILLDGAIIQLMYEFERGLLIKHRLAYYPSPNKEKFLDSPDDYDDLHFGDELFSDILNGKSISFPIRFDFDTDEKKYVKNDHTYIHMTLGNFQNCRIPVSKPLSPNKFISFILRSFYFERFIKYHTIDDFNCTYEEKSYLDLDESKSIHISH